MIKMITNVIPHKPRPEATENVTDLKYYMDGYLRDNLNEVPKFLYNKFDAVILVTGNAKVRCGKSTIALQAAYYLSYILNEAKKKKGEVPKDNPVPFNNTNVVFDPDSLMRLAERLPKNSVIVYDEGRSGTDSSRAMENINKATADFFTECGQYEHVIIIVLPDFFKLNEMIALPRSLFLINTYLVKSINRGYFEFFNEYKKEFLYILGKKRLGSTAKYFAVESNFKGRFTSFFPINKELYEKQKRDALRKRKKSLIEKKWHKHRDILMYILKKDFKVLEKDIVTMMEEFPNVQLSVRTVETAVSNVKRMIEKELGDDY